ncbi:ABC transporter permease subunit [Mycolicibacterium sp. S2-37]|uniref:ABC transporter permease n=1 Tax=Mycolicibacterium sp. S2-37 TaxID=2810297 RepID=UPI001A94C9F6|nr:ABC transporter permease subunit [Mycolicibacterium sp. S2-37]MBO0677600.1 ABC transporter permease subunit [Mycolicibacterium sp. S2-37]
MTAARVERRAGLTVRGWVAVIAAATAVFLEVAPRVGLVDPFSVIPLSEMVIQLGKLLAAGEFWSAALVPSLSAIALAFVLAIVLGVFVGVTLWEIRPLRSVVEPWLTIYYAIPTFALYPLIVAVLGVGLVPIVLLGTMFAIVVVITSTLTGLDATPTTIIRLAASLQLSRLARATKILVPAALPHIVTGSRLALSYALIGVLASEFVLSTSGLGHFISRAYNDFAFADMYAGVLLVFALATLVNAVFAFLAKRQPGVAR